MFGEEITLTGIKHIVPEGTNIPGHTRAIVTANHARQSDIAKPGVCSTWNKSLDKVAHFLDTVPVRESES